MNLREYLFRKRMTLIEFAKRIEYDRNYLSNVMHGHLRSTKRLEKTVFRETNGEVDKVYSGGNGRYGIDSPPTESTVIENEKDAEIPSDSDKI